MATRTRCRRRRSTARRRAIEEIAEYNVLRRRRPWLICPHARRRIGRNESTFHVYNCQCGVRATRGSGSASRRVPRKTQTSSYGLPPRPRLAIAPNLGPERLAPREQLRGFFLLLLFHRRRRRRALLGQNSIQSRRIHFVDQRPQLISGIDGSRPPPPEQPAFDEACASRPP